MAVRKEDNVNLVVSLIQNTAGLLGVGETLNAPAEGGLSAQLTT